MNETAGRLQPEFLQAYAQELNPVEHIWGQWKHRRHIQICGQLRIDRADQGGLSFFKRKHHDLQAQVLFATTQICPLIGAIGTVAVNSVLKKHAFAGSGLVEPDLTAELIRAAPKARYWVSTVSLGVDCLICHDSLAKNKCLFGKAA